MKGWKKAVCGTLIAAFMLPQVIIGSGGVAEAASGTWKHSSKGWWYSYSDGTYAKSAWVKDGGKWYYFDAKGYMVTGWQKINNKWYYFGTNGAMQTGWKKIDGKWYYFGTNGVMVNNWKKIDGKWYYFVGGAMQTGWKKISGAWHYFNGSGVMTTGWKTISGQKYYFDENGVMATGTKTIDGKEYTFGEDGVLVENLLKKAEVGDTITFGKYEQDNDLTNGKEDIEWIVLDKKADGKLLVISKYGLDAVVFNEKNNLGGSTWPYCTLRKWMNGGFFASAFSSDEMNKIADTMLGDAITDKLFLLSLEEANTYFGEDEILTDNDLEYHLNSKRACKPTEYAKVNNAYVANFDNPEYFPAFLSPYNGYGWWWLRSNGPAYAGNNYYVNVVTAFGEMSDYGYAPWYDDTTKYQQIPQKGLFRPAMWIQP